MSLSSDRIAVRFVVTVLSHFFSHSSDNLCASEAKKNANVMFFEISLKKLDLTLNIHKNKHLLGSNRGGYGHKAC
jgi:hypothetical protein